jgi:hypothetical protein
MKIDKITEKKLKDLEKLLLEPGVRKSLKVLSNILADDFVEYGSSGKVYSKKEIINELQSETVQKLKLTDFKLRELGENHFLVTYKAVKENCGQKHYSLRCSIWIKVKDEYQMIFHQGTKIN